MSVRVAIDTNILLSEIIWPRWPYAVLGHALAGDIQLVVPEIVLMEARRQVDTIIQRRRLPSLISEWRKWIE